MMAFPYWRKVRGLRRMCGHKIPELKHPQGNLIDSSRPNRAYITLVDTRDYQ